MKEAQINQSQLTQFIGKSKSAIRTRSAYSNFRRTCRKPSSSAASRKAMRWLMMIEDPIEKQKLFAILLEQKMSVESSDLARRIQNAPQETPRPTPRTAHVPGREKTPEIKDMENHLQHTLWHQGRHQDQEGSSTGTITIHFYSTTDFDRILGILNK